MAKEFTQASCIPEVIEKFRLIFGQNKINDEYSDSSDDDDEDDLFFDEAISYSDSSIDHDDPLLMHLIQETRARANDRNLAFHRALRKKKGANERDLTMLHAHEVAQKNAEELMAEEEREKKKAEKRKAKKKRRREKKKEERDQSAGDKNNKKDTTPQSSKKTSKSKVNGEASTRQHDDKEDEEDFLDPNSAFVSVAVNKNKRNTTVNTAITHMDRSQRPTSSKKTGDAEDAMVIESESLAVEGYNAASREEYAKAVEFFSKAIHLVHNDHRFYGNRSFCYCQLGQYVKALKDADKAIKFAPQSPKGYYRRGEALRGLKQYKQAEEAFERVVQLDEDCEDARQELENVKILQVMEMGFSEDQAYTAIQQCNTVQMAVEMLTAETSVTSLNTSVGEIFYSDDEENFLGSASSSRTLQQATLRQQANKMDPSNPEGHLSLWVGNITQIVTEKQLFELFSRFGVVLSVRLLPEKFCAFINFRDKSSPGPAMKQLQGKEIGGEKLLIRYPNNPVPEQIVLKKTAPAPSGTSQAKLTGPVNGDECHFWRTTGCVFGDKCRYKHRKENKGIDKKPWQKAI